MNKLLIINVCSNYGSTGKIAEQCGVLMKQKGWDVYCACGERLSNPSELKLIKFSSTIGIYCHKLISLFFDSEGKGSFFATKRLVSKIKKINPDIIHLHNIHGHYINYRILFEYLKESGKPVVWTLHDCWPMTGHCAYADFPKCDKWMDGCGKCPGLRKYPCSLFVDRSRINYIEKQHSFSAVNNMTLVPVSEWMDGIKNKSFVRQYPSIVVHNGIDLNLFKIINCKRPKDKYLVAGAANVWDLRKGLPDVICLRRLLPDNIEIVLAGLSKKQIRSLPDGIKGLPRIKSDKLVRFYSEADVFINPTYEDNYPTSNMEAIACGTPVITYRTGGSPESVPPEVGYVVEKGNINALAEAIEKLRKNPISSETCRKYAEEHFDKDKCFSEYVKLYESKVNLQSAFDKAKAQAMIGVSFHKLQPMLEETGVKDKLYFEWLGLAGKIQQRNEVLNRQCVTLQQKLSERGIRSTILKGQGVAALYGAELSLLRQPGDIDVYVDCGLDKAVELAKSIGQTKIEWDYKHLHLNVFKGTSVEVHYRPQVFLNPWRNKKLQKYFKDNDDRLFGGKAYLKDCGEITVPEPDINVVYLLAHMYHHLFSEGFGHKQVMDLYYSLKAADDRQRIAEDIDILGMRKFAKGMMWVLSECYGMSESEMFCTPDEKEGRFLLDKIVGGGNFSNKLHGNRARRLLQVCKVNMALLIHYPGDATAAPLYYIWHFFWKRRYARKHHLTL